MNPETFDVHVHDPRTMAYWPCLLEREKEVMMLRHEGLTRRQISERIFLALGYVDNLERQATRVLKGMVTRPVSLPKKKGCAMITKAEIIAALQQAGRYYTMNEWRQGMFLPSGSTIRNRFGSWDAAWTEARIVNPATLKDDPSASPNWDLLDDLSQRYLMSRYHNVSQKYAAKACGLSVGRARRLEVSATNILLTGIVPSTEPKPTNRITREDILQEIRAQGRYITKYEWRKMAIVPCPVTILKHFSTWDEAFAVAGFPAPQPSSMIDPETQAAFPTLSTREQRIVKARYRGITYREIAAQENLSMTRTRELCEEAQEKLALHMSECSYAL